MKKCPKPYHFSLSFQAKLDAHPGSERKQANLTWIRISPLPADLVVLFLIRIGQGWDESYAQAKVEPVFI